MPFTLTMPKLSPTMEEGTITKWCVKEGELVKSDQVLIEVATDKATVEHSAIDKGYLRKILVPAGSEAAVNQAIAIFTETLEESIEGYKPEGITPAPKEEAPIAAVKADENVTSEAPKAASRSTDSGLKTPAFAPEDPLSNYDFSSFANEGNGLYASPYAKKLAKEKGIDLTTVRGTGPHGRIMSRDLSSGQPDSMVAFGRHEIPQALPGSFEEEKLSPMRKVIGQRLQESKTFIPHFYVTQEVDAEPLQTLREQLKAFDIKLSVNDFIVRAAALALREHPVINSGFNSVNNSIIRFKTIDISIAVSIDSGLITPIVRYADYKNIGQISTEVKALAAKAKNGKLAREEYVGGSFTISNLGMFGITEFMGIINPPQAAILCVGGVQEKPVVKNQAIVPGKTFNLTLCSDHRVIDGTDAAKFLVAMKKLLESPSVLLVS